MFELRVGTSGYSYKEWKGSFYPKDLSAGDMLSFYASKLPAVEINNTFYRLPKTSVLEAWADQVPAEFRFAIKASRRITHLKRLKEVDEEVGYLLGNLEVLGERLGVVLYQLPPNMKKDLDRLDRFLELLAGGPRAVLEFRHESWFEDDVLDRLRAAGCALCHADVDETPESDLTPTADFGYLRLRREQYGRKDLKRWVEKVRGQDWSEAFVFFKHEDEGAGPKLAAQFLEAAKG